LAADSSDEEEGDGDVKPSGMILHENMVQDEEAYEKWCTGRCEYKCSICDKKFNITFRFWEHVKGRRRRQQKSKNNISINCL
jgi:hypothetical protein